MQLSASALHPPIISHAPFNLIRCVLPSPKVLPRVRGLRIVKDHSNSRVSQWVYNPWVDLVAGCGAWSAPLLLISYFTLATNARTWSVVFYVLALFFNYPHYMATIYRAYHRAEDFHKYRVFTVHITALMVLTLLLSHVWLQILPWIFTIYLTWSPWHYSGQNYGILMMFARRSGADPGKAGSRALYGAFIASYLILFLGFHTGPSSDPLFVSLGIPPVVSRWEQVVLSIAFLALSVFGFSRLARRTEWKRLIPCLTLFSSQFLWFFVPEAISLIRGLAVPQNRYSSGVLAVMHSAQYLWITSYYARREATASSGASSAAKDWRPAAYFGILVLGGIALFVPGPWMASRAFHHDFTASFLIFTALVNIHHFILDGAIWKLRDGRIAALLVNSRVRIGDAAAQASSRAAAVMRWIGQNSWGWRALRVTAAVLLLVWGTVDQVRYYLAMHAENLSDLQRAIKLNAFDSGLQMRLARRAMEDGDLQQAETAWKRAMQSNPKDPSPRQGLLQLLIEQDRYDEALGLTESSLQYSPRDANLLIDHGFLMQHAGHADEARKDWEKAIRVDPDQINAHLYLADELDREGNPAAAAWHLKLYLEMISRKKADDRPAPDNIIALVLRMADCQARASQTDVALKSYGMAELLAVQTRQPKLESVAEVNGAALEAKAGRVSEALATYQQALRLDDLVGDYNASGEDWLAFARFLDESGFPARFAYACVLKSQQQRRLVHGTEAVDPAANLRQSLERQLGAAAASIQLAPDRTAEQALQFRP
jgi:tetratricopeptide (TPR) repeat protein